MFKVELKLQDLTIKEYNLHDGDSLSIGRLSSNDIVVQEKSVSRHHAIITRDSDTLTVWDKGSTNGIIVNESKVLSATLKDGDLIWIGAKYHLKTTISLPKKKQSTITGEPLLCAGNGANSLDVCVEWHKDGAGTWWTLAEANLEDEYFDALEGVYIIWYEDQKQVTLRVGRGHIRDCIVSERNNQDMWRHAQLHEIFVTWAEVGRAYLDNVARYIAETVKPNLESRYQDVEPSVVNLPWYDQDFSLG
jgi:hypothetical protein